MSPTSRNVDVSEMMPFTDEDKHVTLLQRETPEFIPPTDVAIQLAGFESGGLLSGVSFKKGSPFMDP